MKRSIAMAAAVLLAMPGAAMAQNWQFATPNADKECYAMTFRGRIAIGFQAPNGDRAGGIMVLAPPEQAKSGDPVITIGATGVLGGDHVAKAEEDSRLNVFFMRVEEIEDFDSLPDKWRASMTRGSQKVVDTDITGFREALANVRRCVAAR